MNHTEKTRKNKGEVHLTISFRHLPQGIKSIEKGTLLCYYNNLNLLFKLKEKRHAHTTETLGPS